MVELKTPPPAPVGGFIKSAPLQPARTQAINIVPAAKGKPARAETPEQKKQRKAEIAARRAGR